MIRNEGRLKRSTLNAQLSTLKFCTHYGGETAEPAEEGDKYVRRYEPDAAAVPYVRPSGGGAAQRSSFLFLAFLAALGLWKSGSTSWAFQSSCSFCRRAATSGWASSTLAVSAMSSLRL